MSPQPPLQLVVASRYKQKFPGRTFGKALQNGTDMDASTLCCTFSSLMECSWRSSSYMMIRESKHMPSVVVWKVEGTWAPCGIMELLYQLRSDFF